MNKYLKIFLLGLAWVVTFLISIASYGFLYDSIHDYLVVDCGGLRPAYSVLNLIPTLILLLLAIITSILILVMLIKKTNWKKWLIVGVALAVILGIGFIFSNLGHKNSDAECQSQNQNTVFNQISTADWKTYENKDLGFSFQYPKDWILTLKKGFSGKEPILTIASPKTIEEGNNCSKNYYEGCVFSDLSIFAYPSIDNVYTDNPLGAKTIEELIKKGGITTKTGTKNVGGVEATEVVEGGMAANYALMLIPDNGFFFEIFFDHWDGFDNKPKVYSSTENLILSTFQFTK